MLNLTPSIAAIATCTRPLDDQPNATDLSIFLKICLALKKIDELQSLVPKGDEAPDILNASAHAAYLHEDQVDLAQTDFPDASMELPPLHEVLSATESYLTTHNAILPLFHPGRLLQLIDNWFRSPGQREPASMGDIQRRSCAGSSPDTIE